MSEKTENPSNALDIVKWLVVFALLAGLITANHFYSEVSVPLRALVAVIIAVVAAGIAATTVKGHAFFTFAKESRIEVRKVIWPTRAEANQTTLIVALAVLVMSLVLWGLDGIIVELVSLITGIGV